MTMQYHFSISEIADSILDILLVDRTTGKNIIWATNAYEKFSAQNEITCDVLNENIIQPRFMKSEQLKKIRVREKAEIFTPSWLCNEQNNLIDEVWFGRSNVFNKIIDAQNHIWQATSEKIIFDGGSTWQNYVESNRIEITCGEAPYLVSRYDTVSGEIIPLENRIGLLDRKFRVIFENTSTESEWLEWSRKAVQSIYGYEFQGDNLFLARKNIFDSCVDYFKKRFDEMPDKNFSAEIAEIISWNLWQMDGLTNTIPYAKIEINLFDENFVDNVYCLIKDWKENKILQFKNILESGRR